MRRLVPVATLLAIAASGATASAAGSTPVTGTWSAKAPSGEGVRFQLVKTRKGYRARSTRLFVIAPCTSSDPNAPTPRPEDIRDSGITVTLKKSGKRLVGVRNIDETDRGGSAQYGIRMTFTSARRATVVLSASESPSQYDENGNMDYCKGRITLTAKPGPA